MNLNWNQSENEYLIQHYPDLGVQACSLHLNRSPNSILHQTSRLGLKIKTKYTPHVIDFIRTNYPTHGVRFCCQNLNLSKPEVMHVVQRILKIKMNNQHTRNSRIGVYRAPRRLLIDSEQILTTPELVYFLGYLWADGTVGKRRPVVRMQIATDDFLKIEPAIQRILLYSVHSVIKKKQHHKNVSCFYMYDRTFHEWLMKYDFHLKSSVPPIQLLKNISPEYKHLFILGWFDGDGSCYSNKQHRTHEISIISGVDQSWSCLTTILTSLDISYQESQDNRKHGQSSRIRITNIKDIHAFRDYIYSTREKDYLGLKRKFDRISQIEIKANRNKNTSAHQPLA